MAKLLQSVLDARRIAWDAHIDPEGGKFEMVLVCLACEQDWKDGGRVEEKPIFPVEYGEAHDNKCPCGGTFAPPRLKVGY